MSDTRSEAAAPKPGFARRVQDLVDDYVPQGGWLKVLLVILAVYLVVVLVLGVLWSAAPEPFDVNARVTKYIPRGAEAPPTGAVTTAALIGVVETLLEKRGGFLYNDRMPPGVYLDNMPNWEYGALIQARDLGRAMREVLSRSQSQSKEDPDLAIAEPRLNFQTNSWLLPASESEYRDGLKYFRRYLERLTQPENPDADFYARADNLRDYLSMVNSRLGSLSQRLSASVGQRSLSTSLTGDPRALRSTLADPEQDVKTPWAELDDVFFEARGSAWALLHFLRALSADFEDVLENKNATVSLKQIIRQLEPTQDAIWSPIILNGTGFGFLANHSLVMASYLSRANAGVIDLRNLLDSG
ncbi:DUF2333 family protein [Chromatocurvus halotolerans]|uniref:DUF2333 family protein n=1 Tax=Chromatocurvus halotolerans TaxID=1132028 RepID=A0A4R2KMA2_9GAMM|nr:DUF2333 family protein [Chromatocurvus halotolerans]TCO71879.1 hypothetical protein EV688_12033 [Chromatocurvus halotolerans]